MLYMTQGVAMSICRSILTPIDKTGTNWHPLTFPLAPPAGQRGCCGIV